MDPVRGTADSIGGAVDMPETTDSEMPAWWNEIADDLAHLNIASVAVANTGIPKSPAWTVVIVLHADHLHIRPQDAPARPGMCVAIPWAFAARATEADAWKAAEMFLRGLVAVRNGTMKRVPGIAQETTAMRQQIKGVCSAVDSWHNHFHGLKPTEDSEGVRV
jgi:hypothetical protein